MIEGAPKITGLAVTYVCVAWSPTSDVTRSPPPVTAKAMYLGGEDAAPVNHGTIEGRGPWSERTRAALEELRHSLELDLAADHFDSTSSEESGAQLEGLAEHLGAEPQPL